jgi:hypothetical protein
MFWYFYSPAHYDKIIFYEIRLSLRRSHRKDYNDATFKSSWRGSSQLWFLVDMHIPPQWANRHLLPPLIDNKRGEPEMTSLLAALVKWVAELHDAGLRASYCTKEFIFD